MKKSMIKRASIILIMCFTLFNNAFSSGITLGVKNKGTKKFHVEALGEDEARLYAKSYHNNNVYAEAYDKSKNQKLIFSTEIVNFKVEDKYKTRVERVKYIGDKFYAFYSYYNKDKHTYNLIVKTLNGKTGKFNSNTKTLFSRSVENKRRSGDFDVYYSKDNSKIFIYHEAYSKTKKKNVRIYYLLSSELDVLYKHELDNNDYMPSRYLIDNDGSIYYTTTKDKGVYIGILDANKDFERWEEKLKIEVEKEFSNYVFNYFLSTTENNELLISGLFSEKEKLVKKKKNGKEILTKKEKWHLKGTFLVKLDDESKEIEYSKTENFTEEFLNQFKTEKDEEKDRDVNMIDSYSIGETFDRGDGGSIMVVESYYYFRSRDTDGNTTGEHYYYGDIIAVSFNKDGSVEWTNRVPKRQIYYWQLISSGVYATSRGPRAMLVGNEYTTLRHFSSTSFVKDGKLNILFNDLIENIENTDLRQKPKKLKKINKSVVCNFQIDLKTGKTSKSAYTELLKTGTLLSPVYSGKVPNSDSVLLFGIKTGNYTMTLVK